jgi:hypothetical protein
MRPNGPDVRTVVAHLFAVVLSRGTSKPTVDTPSRSHAATAIVRLARRGIFPLDKQLALLPGRLTPLLQDHLTHLGTWMPFAKAAALLECFTHTPVSESTAQRLTESVGMAYEAIQLAEVERIERDWPEAPEGPAKLVVSADGAMVPLLAGEWAEVKTLVVSEVGEASDAAGERQVHTHSHSYFSRLTDAESFQRLSLGEMYRRGVENTEQVGAVNDGAEWIQGLWEYHCPAALRILDFPHAAERVSQIGDVVLGEGSAEAAAWRTDQLHRLKHEGATEVVPELRSFAAVHLTLPLVAENMAYLEKRVAQMQYPVFQAQGWPIGSGVVESGNKLVVEARLKGAGMHWARASVNPMLALRNAVCNDRWDEAWQQSSEQIRRVGLVRRAVTPKRVAAPEDVVAKPAVPASVVDPPVERAPHPKPAANHPWRRYRATKARMDLAEPRART